MSEFYLVEFPNEEDEKSRGPHIVPEDRVRVNDVSENEVEVKWNVINSKGEIIDPYFTGVKLFKGTKKACADFKDKLRKNREIAEIGNKESRERKKSAKLREQDDNETMLFGLNDGWNLSGPPKKKPRTYSKPDTPENENDLEEDQELGGSGDDSVNYETPKKPVKKLEQNTKPKITKKASGEKSGKKGIDPKKLRQETMQNQSAEIETNLRKKMKVVRDEDGGESEFEISVEKDMKLQELKKRLASATGISAQNLSLVVRGETVDDDPPETKITEFWSVEDIVALFPKKNSDAQQSKSDQIILDEGEENLEKTVGGYDECSTKVFVDTSSKSCSFPTSATLEQKIEDLGNEVRSLRDNILEMKNIMSSFLKCRNCIKLQYKSTPFMTTFPLEANTSLGAESSTRAATFSSTPVSPAADMGPVIKTPPPKETYSSTPPLNNSGQQGSLPTDPEDDQVLVGAASRGVYVPARQLNKITTALPSNYVLKLFELVFSRSEASLSSVEGKGEKLKKLDENRLSAAFEQHNNKFKNADNKLSWETMKKIIDSKCRMVRNNRCKTWAGKES